MRLPATLSNKSCCLISLHLWVILFVLPAKFHFYILQPEDKYLKNWVHLPQTLCGYIWDGFIFGVLEKGNSQATTSTK